MIPADRPVAAGGAEDRSVVQAGSGLLAGLRLDLDTAARAFPFGRLIVPLAALLIGAGIGWLRPGYASLYGESLAVIVVLIAVGSFGRVIAAIATIAFGIADMAHFLVIADPTIGAQVSRDTTVGRVVTEGVLWLAVVVVPSVSRRVEWIAEERLGGRPRGLPIGAAVGAAAAGVGTYLWANVMPYLVRPAYKFAPPPPELRPQQEPELLALAAAGAFFAVTLFLRRRAVAGAELGPLLGLPSRGIPGFIVRVIAYAVATALLLGVLGGITDVAILWIGFVAGEALAFVGVRPAARNLVRSLPRTIIGVGGFVVVFLIALVVGGIAQSMWPKGTDSSPFLPIVVTSAVAFALVRLVLALAAGGQEGSATFPVSPAVVGAVALLVAVGLLFPATALADNCANLGDCGFSQRFLLVISGFAAFFGAGAAAASGGGGNQNGGGGGGGGGHGGGGGSQPKQPPPPPPPPDQNEY